MGKTVLKSILFDNLTSDPSLLSEGLIWFRSDLKQLREYRNGATRVRGIAEKLVIVNTLSDLPTPAAGKITLAASTAYMLAQPINLGTNYIEMSSNTRLDSVGKDLTTLTYTGTGAAIRGIGISCIIREIKVSGAEEAFNFSGSKIAEKVGIFQCNFSGCDKVGTIDKLFSFSFKNSSLDNNVDGLLVTDSSYVLIESTDWFGNNAGTYIDIPSGTFVSIKITGNNLEVNGTDVGLDVDAAAVVHTQDVVFTNNTITGTSSNRIMGHDPLDGSFISIGNTGTDNLQILPQRTLTELFNISSPRESMQVYCTSLDQIVYWDGVKWLSISGIEIFQEDFTDDFESGSLATNGWVKVDGGENDFEIGPAENNGGTYGVYVSNDNGASATYTSLGGALDVSHLYIDILMPAATSELVLQFDWKCEGEVNYDACQIFDVPTTTTPVANTELVAGQIGLGQYNNQAGWATEQIALPLGEASTTRRIVFSWRNDSSVENNPPICIDNVKILFK